MNLGQVQEPSLLMSRMRKTGWSHHVPFEMQVEDSVWPVALTTQRSDAKKLFGKQKLATLRQALREGATSRSFGTVGHYERVPGQNHAGLNVYAQLTGMKRNVEMISFTNNYQNMMKLLDYRCFGQRPVAPHVSQSKIVLAAAFFLRITACPARVTKTCTEVQCAKDLTSSSQFIEDNENETSKQVIARLERSG